MHVRSAQCKSGEVLLVHGASGGVRAPLPASPRPALILDNACNLLVKYRLVIYSYLCVLYSVQYFFVGLNGWTALHPDLTVHCKGRARRLSGRQGARAHSGRHGRHGGRREARARRRRRRLCVQPQEQHLPERHAGTV